LEARTIPPAEAHAPRTRLHLAQAGRLETLLRQSCYGAVSPYEVSANGRKVLGLDQVRRRVGFLFQGGLLLRWDAERVASLLAAEADERPQLAAGLRKRAAGLEELLQRAIAPEEIIRRFEARLQQRHAVDVRATAVPASLDEQAHAFAEQRYHPLLDEAPARERA